MVVGRRDSATGSRRAGVSPLSAEGWVVVREDVDAVVGIEGWASFEDVDDELPPQEGHHEEDDDDVVAVVGAIDGFGSDAAFGLTGAVGVVAVALLLLLLLLPPNSACICAMNFAISGSPYAGSGALAGVSAVFVLLVALLLASPFGAAPDDQIQPIFFLRAFATLCCLFVCFQSRGGRVVMVMHWGSFGSLTKSSTCQFACCYYA